MRPARRANRSSVMSTRPTLIPGLLLAGVATLVAGEAQAQAPPLAEATAGDDFLGAVHASREIVRELMEAAGAPGASIAVGVGDRIVWAEGFGWADLEQRVPVGEKTHLFAQIEQCALRRGGSQASTHAAFSPLR